MKSKKLGTLVVIALVAVLLIALIYRIVAGLLGLMNSSLIRRRRYHAVDQGEGCRHASDRQ